MKKRIPDPVLMLITILVIIGFQVYWIRDNYLREKRALEIKTNSLFKETVRQVQDSVLKRKLTVVMKDGQLSSFKNSNTGLRTARVATLLGQQIVNDSLKKKDSGNSKLFVTIRQQRSNNFNDNSGNTQYDFPDLRPEDVNEVVVVNTGKKPLSGKKDSVKVEREFRKNHLINNVPGQRSPHEANTIYFNDDEGRQVIIRVDSLLRDSISIQQLSTEYAKALKTENIAVPFSITKREKDTTIEDNDEWIPRFHFGNFAGYNLTLGNTFSYLVNKITLPILFSIFLIGVTILTFILLYRTLLKQQRLAVMKNEFISNITHELKTPIATVGVAIEALRNFGAAQSPERNKEYLDISASELQRLSLLVDKVLKLSMFENKDVELKKESFDIRELLNEVMNIMKLQFEKQHAAVNVTTAGNNFVIEADRLHITSVIYNLLDNALKYSTGNPVINVQLSSLPNDIIELKVSDNGIGIAKEYQPKIFDKFFRVPTGNTHNIKGYGLGLSYVSEILKRHMGFITVESEPGKGSTFTIKLPFKETDEIRFDDKRKIRKETI